MKTLKNYPVSFSWIFVPLIFCTPVIAAFFPKLLHWLFYLNAIYLVLGVVLFSMPLKDFKYDLKSSVYSYFLSFLKISLLQLVLLLVAFDLYIVFIKLMPTSATTHFIQPQLFHLISWGLFPWSAMILMGLALTYYRKKTHDNISLLQTTEALAGKALTRALGAGMQLFLRQGLIITVAIPILAFGLTIYFYAIALGIPKIPFSPNGYTLIIYLLIFTGASSRYWHWLIKIFWRRGFSTLRLFWLQTLFSILMIVILTFLLNLLAKTLGADLSQGILFPIPQLPIHYAWELFMWSFWMAAVVFVAPILANIAKGKNPRLILVFGLLWPLVFSALWICHDLQSNWNQFFIALNKPSIVLSLNAIVSVFISLFFWFNKTFEQQLYQSFYCQNNAAKNPHVPIKSLTKILRLMSLFLLLYLFDGINLLSLVLFGMTSTCFAIYSGIGLCLFKSLWFEK